MTGVIRLLPDGPKGQGLALMDVNPAEFEVVPIEQRIHAFYENADLGFAVGVWTTTDMKEAFGPYPGDEFMVVLEGRVEMLDGEGGSTPIETGQGFAVRNAAPLSWRQVGFLKKVFLLMDPDGTEPSEGPGVVVAPREAGAVALSNASEMIGGGHQREVALFTNKRGNMEAGIWETTTFETEAQPFSVHEFAHITEGSVTITDSAGAHRFDAGDSLFIPAGTVCAWKAEGLVRKFYATVTPH